MIIRLPYGHTTIEGILPDDIEVDIMEPPPVVPALNPRDLVRSSLQDMHGAVKWDDFTRVKRVGIAINDKTRPVPHEHLLPPLMQQLERLGIPDEAITFYVAVGTHSPMEEDTYPSILPSEIIDRYKIVSHDSDADDGLIFLGNTRQGTPVWINKGYYQAELKIVVGNIAPHQFMGFSGGAKSAAIGLASRKTIKHNHALMTNPNSELGIYETNPARQDVEEIGRMIGVHIAVNAILTQEKEIIHVISGNPKNVMEDGIPQIGRAHV